MPLENGPSLIGSESVLLLDADPTTRKLAAFMLTKQGYAVTEARNAEEALRIAAYADFDLLLTEAFPSKTNGLAIAEILQQDRPRLSVIFMHDEHQRRMVKEWKTARCATLQKPFTMRRLAGCVRETLDRSHARALAIGF